MKGSWLWIGAAAAGVLLGGARGALADPSWHGQDGLDRGQRYESQGWNNWGRGYGQSYGAPGWDNGSRGYGQQGWNDRGAWYDQRDQRSERARARDERWDRRDERHERRDGWRGDAADRWGSRGDNGYGQRSFTGQGWQTWNGGRATGRRDGDHSDRD